MGDRKSHEQGSGKEEKNIFKLKHFVVVNSLIT